MTLLQDLIHFVFTFLGDPPFYLNMWAAQMGSLMYVPLFLVIFAETGLIVCPLLPGDSLLFAIGALAAQPDSPIQIGFTIGLLISAAVFGDLLNFTVGKYVGPKLFARPNSRLMNPKYLQRTQDFFAKYGGKAIVMARFVPIVRTYAPFVAGLGQMKFSKFASFSVFGGVIWITSFILLGYFFGNLPFVKSRFSLVILMIILVSISPILWKVVRAKCQAQERGSH